jgi:hypothetical protein
MSRTIKAHRADIRKFLGFRECTVPRRQADRVREQLLAHLMRHPHVDPFVAGG